MKCSPKNFAMCLQHSNMGLIKVKLDLYLAFMKFLMIEEGFHVFFMF